MSLERLVRGITPDELGARLTTESELGDQRFVEQFRLRKRSGNHWKGRLGSARCSERKQHHLDAVLAGLPARWRWSDFERVTFTPIEDSPGSRGSAPSLRLPPSCVALEAVDEVRRIGTLRRVDLSLLCLRWLLPGWKLEFVERDLDLAVPPRCVVQRPFLHKTSDRRRNTDANLSRRVLPDLDRTGTRRAQLHARLDLSRLGAQQLCLRHPRHLEGSESALLFVPGDQIGLLVDHMQTLRVDGARDRLVVTCAPVAQAQHAP